MFSNDSKLFSSKLKASTNEKLDILVVMGSEFESMESIMQSSAYLLNYSQCVESLSSS